MEHLCQHWSWNSCTVTDTHTTDCYNTICRCALRVKNIVDYNNGFLCCSIVNTLTTSSVLATESYCVGLKVSASQRINCPDRSNLKITAAITNGSTFVSSKSEGFNTRNITLTPEGLSPGTYSCAITTTLHEMVIETTNHLCNIPQPDGEPNKLILALLHV